MTRTVQSRVLTLVGLGVFAAGAALSLVSRHSLLAVEAAFDEEQRRLAAALAQTLTRDLVNDQQVLQGTATALSIELGDDDMNGERRLLASALRSSHLGSVTCVVTSRGDPLACEPAPETSRVAPALRALVPPLVASPRPSVSDLILVDRVPMVAVSVPVHGDGESCEGFVIELVEAGGRHLMSRDQIAGALLADGAGRTIASTSAQAIDPTSPAARVAGTAWTLRIEPATSVTATVAFFRRTSLWLTPVLTALATLLAWGVALSVRRPLADLTKAAERIADGNLSDPVPVATADEIGRLASALERMRSRLEQSLDTIARWNAELERRVETRTMELQALNVELHDRERARQRLLRQVISAQEDERRRVARELHDETSQLVAAIGIRLSSGAPAPELQTLVHRLHEGLHRLIVNLRPSILDDLGLAAAIQSLAEQQLARNGVNVRCELGDLDARRLADHVEIVVFRVVQEAIANIARHARAESVLIEGGIAGAQLYVDIEDDGCGFDPGQVAPGHDSLCGVGLLGMRERMELVAGTIVIDSAPGDGTRIRIQVPIQTRV